MNAVRDLSGSDAESDQLWLVRTALVVFLVVILGMAMCCLVTRPEPPAPGVLPELTNEM
jgi:hypothetical protein